MPEAFHVDPETLVDAVDRMAEFQRYVEGMLTEIDSLVTNLHATWSGEAAAAHIEAHRRWACGEAMMREALGQLRAAGSTAHANFGDAMAKNLGMWS
jgi:WXG100 family type VII secretion target